MMFRFGGGGGCREKLFRGGGLFHRDWLLGLFQFRCSLNRGQLLFAFNACTWSCKSLSIFAISLVGVVATGAGAYII